MRVSVCAWCVVAWTALLQTLVRRGRSLPPGGGDTAVRLQWLHMSCSVLEGGTVLRVGLYQIVY